MKQLIFFLLLCISYAVTAQETKVDLQQQIMLNGGIKFPSVEVQDIQTGERFNLSRIGIQQLKFSDKPTVIIAWSDVYCGPCIKLITKILEDNLDNECNIITLNVDDAKKTNYDLQKQITGRKLWGRITHVRIDAKQYEQLFQTNSVPYFFILNKDQLLLSAFNTYAVTIQELRDLLDVTMAKPNFTSVLYFKNSVLVSKKNADTYVQIEHGATTSSIRSYYLATNKLKYEGSFIKKNSTWLYDGVSKQYTEGGKLLLDAKLEKGVILSMKKWDEKGNLKEDVLLPATGEGYYKVWGYDGAIEQQLTYLDKKLHGLSKYYTANGLIEKTVNYKNGLENGVTTEFIDGVAVKETIYKDGKKLSSTILKEQVASLQASLIASVNKLVWAKEYMIIEEGIIKWQSSAEDKTFEFMAWADLKKMNSVSYYRIDCRGTYGSFTSSYRKKQTPIMLKGEKFYPVMLYDYERSLFLEIKKDATITATSFIEILEKIQKLRLLN